MLQAQEIADKLVMYFIEHGMQILTRIVIPFPQTEVSILGKKE